MDEQEIKNGGQNIGEVVTSMPQAFEPLVDGGTGLENNSHKFNDNNSHNNNDINNFNDSVNNEFNDTFVPMVDGSNINDLVNNSYYINDSNSHNINDNDLVNNNEFNDTDGIQELYFEKKLELDGETDEQVVNDVDPNPDQIESKIDEVGSVANGYNEMTDNSLDHQGPILQN